MFASIKVFLLLNIHYATSQIDKSTVANFNAKVWISAHKAGTHYYVSSPVIRQIYVHRGQHAYFSEEQVSICTAQYCFWQRYFQAVLWYCVSCLCENSSQLI